MKTIKLLFLILSSSVWTCCSKEETETPENGKQDTTDFTVKSKLIGIWVEFHPCDSCFVLTFESNDTIVQLNTSSDEELHYAYEILSDDSIKVTRLWDILSEVKTTEHKINFINNDTLELIQFFAVSYGITGFEDVKLYKTK